MQTNDSIFGSKRRAAMMLLGDVKIIFQRMLPVHKLDCNPMLADRLAGLDPITQLFIGLLIQVVEIY